MRVHTLGEARNWFLSNATEPVTCVKAFSERECRTYSESEQFYLATTTDEMQSSIDSRPDDDDISTGIVLGLIESELLSEGFDTSSSSTDTDSKFDAGGGDFGGAGAGSDF